MYKREHNSVSVLLCLFFLFEVTGVNCIRVRPTGAWTPPALLLVFLLLLPLLLTLPLLFFGRHIVVVVLLLLCGAPEPACAKELKINTLLSAARENVQTPASAKWKNMYPNNCCRIMNTALKVSHLYLNSFVFSLSLSSKNRLWRNRASLVWKLLLFSQSNSKRRDGRGKKIENWVKCKPQLLAKHRIVSINAKNT